MENMSLSAKLEFLRQHRDWKCQKKWEVLEEHDTTWQKNGLTDLKYNIINETKLNDQYCTKFTVDILLNEHWTDNECFITERI